MPIHFYLYICVFVGAFMNLLMLNSHKNPYAQCGLHFYLSSKYSKASFYSRRVHHPYHRIPVLSLRHDNNKSILNMPTDGLNLFDSNAGNIYCNQTYVIFNFITHMTLDVYILLTVLYNRDTKTHFTLLCDFLNKYPCLLNGILRNKFM